MTNAEFFATLTVAQLKDRLKDFNAVGFSKSRKSELVHTLALLMDGAHLDAIVHDSAFHTPVSVMAEAMRKASREGEEMLAEMITENSAPLRILGMDSETRLSVYAMQRGSLTAKLTPRQMRRLISKAKRGRKVAV